MQRQQMQPQPLPSTSPNRAEHQLNSWPNVDFDWELPMDSSLLATVDFGANTQRDEEFLMYPTSIEFNNESHIRTPAGYHADQIELSMPTTLLGTPSSGTAIAPSTNATRPFTGCNGPEALNLPTGSSYPAGEHASTATTVPRPPEIEMEGQDEQPVDLGFWADKITPLFVQFTQHLQSLPHVNLDSLDQDKSHGTLPRPSGSHNSDHTFDLSESFINVLSGMCSRLPPLNAPSTADEGWPIKHLTLDEPSYLLVFSTYLRFLEMHDTVLRYLIACLSCERESTATGSCFYLPKLIIGSFSLAMTSETRPLLFVNLMESMLARAQNLFHRLASVNISANNEGSFGCFPGLSPIVEPTVALQAVQAREAVILTLVERIKTTLSLPRFSRK